MGTNRANGSLYTEVRDRVARVEFGHPDGNSFVSEMLDRLASEFNALSANSQVGAIILCSEGKDIFCAGASLKELMVVQTPQEGTEFFSGFAKVLNAMRLCTKPILGRVQGKAVGGGVGLVAACDYVFATEAAAIRLSEISIGIAPLVIAPAVERKAGKTGLAELSLSPLEWKNAYWAKEKGLYSRVYDSISELDRDLDFFSVKLASFSPDALQALTSVLWEGTAHWETLLTERAVLSGKLALSKQSRQALEKFRNR